MLYSDSLNESWSKKIKILHIGNHQYQTVNLGSYNSSEMDDVDKKYIPGPYGGYLLKFQGDRPLHIIRNDGVLHDSPSYQGAFETVKRLGYPSTDARNVFWCNNGYIGILDYKGGITIVTMHAEYVAYYKSDADIDRVTCDYPFQDGIAFYTESGGTYDFYIFTYSSHSLGKLCPGDKLTQSAEAIAYYDGKGFLAFSDKTLGIVNPQAENGEYVTLINKFEFSPYALRMSPHGSLIACYDYCHLFVRSTRSPDCFPPISIKETQNFGDIVFLDESTIAFIVKFENGETQVFTFQIDQKGVEQKVELFRDCRITHLIQSDESVRVYKRTKEEDTDFYDLFLITPLSEKLDLIFKRPYTDLIEQLLRAKNCYDKEDIDCYKILEDLHGNNQKKKSKYDNDHDQLLDLLLAIVDAAPYILEISAAQELLSNAAFGKYFVKDFPHEQFAECIMKMRVLYNLRKCESFVTVANDIENIDMTDFLSYIVQTEKYEFAEQIARMHSLNRGIIAENWAIRMFSKLNRHDSQECLQVIVDEVLSRYDGIDFLRVAQMAIYYSIDPTITKKIVNLIGDPQVRMNFIIKNKAIFSGSNDALEAVKNSKDGNAIISYLCIQRIENNVIVRSLLKEPILQELYSAFMSQEYHHSKPFGYERVMDIENYPAIKKFQLELIHGYRKYGYGFGLSKENLENARKLVGGGIWGTQITNQIKVIDQMIEIGWRPERPTDDLAWRPRPACSPRRVMENAVLGGKDNAFKALASIYEVNKSTQCWIKLSAFAREKKWEALKEWAKKSQALDWEVFAEVCAENGNMDLAVHFIEKISNNDRRIDAYISFKMLKEALALAQSTKNSQKINMIRQMMGQ